MANKRELEVLGKQLWRKRVSIIHRFEDQHHQHLERHCHSL